MLISRAGTSSLMIISYSCRTPLKFLTQRGIRTCLTWQLIKLLISLYKGYDSPNRTLCEPCGFGHDPPMYLRSMTATRCPCPAKVQAAMVDPVPPPRITRSNSSSCVFLSTWADEVVFVLFMRIFLSERQVHSWPALMSRVRPPTLLRATVRSQLLAQCALSRVE